MARTGVTRRRGGLLKILFLVSSLEVGGAERVASLLSSAWVGSGHTVTLMPTVSGKLVECAFPMAPEVSVRPLTAEISGRHSWLAKVLALRRLIARERFDIVCSFLTNVNVTAIAATLATNTPVVVSERTFPPQFPLGPVLEMLRRLLYPRADAVVMQTSEGLDWLKARSPRLRAFAIPNPVLYPLPCGKPVVDPLASLDPARRNLIAVGRLSSEKQFDLLIEAFCDLPAHHAQWQLTIIGEGPERPKLEALVNRRDASGIVRLAGRVGNLHDWYERADAFALVSQFEGFPNALAEALAYGLPSLAIDCASGPRDMIVDGVNGVLLERGSGLSELRLGLDRHLSHPWNISQSEIDAFRSRFELETISKSWLSSFDLAMRDHKQ